MCWYEPSTNSSSKAPNFGVDPELAVVTGAAVQAGVIGGGWPLQVCVDPFYPFH